ncbi:SGT1 protein-domain-containing protein [Phlyctochytrium arcticum]|nr:SGT1 protein-domain-containing protein [Phlyctochytrium arcticum]
MERLPTNLALEDVVTYSIYRHGSSRNPAEDGDWTESFLKSVQTYISQWTEGYVWHQEPFVLTTAFSTDLKSPYVTGKTRFGDCLEDEWFIVFILFQISTAFQDIVISVSDNDGQFLLIEAADFLPSWLDPETSENRVFIHKGKLHIIPIPRTPAEIPLYPAGRLPLSTAVSLVAGNALTQTSDAIQRPVSARTSRYPSHISENLHRASVIVPRKVAQLLHHDPQLIAPAVGAFYGRDPVAMKACHDMKHFGASDMVKTTIKLNRAQYAQLVSQQFFSPKKYPLPPSSATSYKASSLGMKITCGFEMLYVDPALQKLAKSDTDLTTETYPFERDQSWQQFLKNLSQSGFFGHELQGSAEYKARLTKAKEQFLVERNRNRFKNNPIIRMDEILSGAPLPDEHLQDTPEDSDSWMEIDPMTLEQSLPDASIANPNDFEEDEDMSDLDEEEKNEMEELSKMLGGFNSFVNKKSGVDGALFPKETDDDEVDSRDIMQPITFSETDFWHTLNSIMGTADGGSTDHQRPKERGASPEQIETANITETHIDAVSNPVEAYMSAMDLELATSRVGADFEKVSGAQASESEEEFLPVDLDVNLVKNILESFSSQQGLPGPAASIMSSLGLSLPPPPKHQ